MAEPTLGERILDAALEWAGVWARVKADDRDSFEDEDEAHERLRTLAARASAADELARAAAALRARVTGALPSGSHLVPGFAVNAYDASARAAADALPVCRWARQGAGRRMTSCGHSIDWYLGGEICPECGGRIVESEAPS